MSFRNPRTQPSKVQKCRNANLLQRLSREKRAIPHLHLTMQNALSPSLGVLCQTALCHCDQYIQPKQLRGRKLYFKLMVSEVQSEVQSVNNKLHRLDLRWKGVVNESYSVHDSQGAEAELEGKEPGIT